MWKGDRKSYIIKYKAGLKDFAYFMLYRNEIDCEADIINNYEHIKKQLILLTIQGMEGELPDDVFAYMKSEISISPDNILEIVSAEEWKINVLKYFGKA